MGLDTTITHRKYKDESFKDYDETDIAYYRKQWYWPSTFDCENCENKEIDKETAKEQISYLLKCLECKTMDDLYDKSDMWFRCFGYGYEYSDIKESIHDYIDTYNKILRIMDSDDFDPKLDKIILYNWW